MSRIGGKDVAAIGSIPDGVSTQPALNTYVWVDDADATVDAAKAAGDTILAEPMDVFDAGRSATFADPEGASISIWQAGRHRGSLVVNAHGGVNFNDLHTRNLGPAVAFYGAVFGWELLELGPGKARPTPTLRPIGASRSVSTTPTQRLRRRSNSKAR